LEAEVCQEKVNIQNELEIMEKGEWKILDSIYAELNHEVTRFDEIATCKAITGGAYNLLLEFKDELDAKRGLLLGANNRDDEGCMVCGDGDYEDDNLIGFCDYCSLSVHNKCYGLTPEVFKEDFICYGCQAFGKINSMLVECVLCNQRGGAMKPLDVKLDIFR
jgi:hypothetical protein